MKKRMTAKQLANLKQYKNASVEEIEQLVEDSKIDFNNEQRVKDYLDKMAEQYDLSELNHNDSAALIDLARISTDIEDQETRYRNELNSEDVYWYEIEKIVTILQKLRADRSKIEYDLNITRRNRQNSEEQSVVETIESLKLRAKKMLQERLNYVYCPKCKMLNATVWFLEPKSGNSLTITCARETCQNKFVVTGSELIDKKNKNLDTVLET